MRKRLLMMSLFLLLASGCSLLSSTNIKSPSLINHHDSTLFPLPFDQPTSIEPSNMSMAERIEKGIDLFYSPDRSLFFVLDNPIDRFHSITLGPKKQQKIFEYEEFFGPGIRDFDELTVFWGGFSDRIYLAWRSGENLNGGMKLWFYSIEDGNWEEVELSFLPQERIRLITSVDETPFMIFEYEELEFGPKKYLLVDVDQQHKETLQLPNRSKILDQQNGVLLLGQLEKEDEFAHQYSLTKYDISTGSTFLLPMTIPLYGGPHAEFVPESDFISYRTLAVVGHNRVYTSVVLFDTITNQSISIPNTQNLGQWNADFSCLYGHQLISCIEKRNSN